MSGHQPSSREELRRLIDQHCEEKLTPAQTERLRQLLGGSDQALVEFVLRMELHGQLQWEYGIGLPSVITDLIPNKTSAPSLDQHGLSVPDHSVPETAPPPSSTTSRPADRIETKRSRHLRRYAAAIAASLIAFFSLLWWNLRDDSSQPIRLAEVSGLYRPIWSEPTSPLTIGDAVSGDLIRLDRGLVELRFTDGATMLVEGPARFSVQSNRSASLQLGRALVRVNSKDGAEQQFRVDTPHAAIIDRGTEFGVDVRDLGPTLVQVYDGAVDLRKGGQSTEDGSSYRLLAQQAARVDTGQMPQPVAFAEQRFNQQLPLSNANQTNTRRLWNSDFDSQLAIRPSSGWLTIDGELGEWQLADSVFHQADASNQPELYAEVFLMYDQTNLYVAAVVGDPHGMSNSYDPLQTPEHAWNGGGVQVALAAPSHTWPPSVASSSPGEQEATAEMLMWYASLSNEPSLFIQSKTASGSSTQTNPVAASGQFARAFNGKTYSLEYSIPWQVIGLPPPEPGSSWKGRITIYWSDRGGRHWRGQVSNVDWFDSGEADRPHHWATFTFEP
ncbi:MAG: FecR domain-containing protein [Pirellulales bacterium]|nr:FecR domain-containing protein [Pirellulales bacterium]